jgi:hypothetical protein
LNFKPHLIDVTREPQAGLRADRNIDATAARLNDDVVIAKDVCVLGPRVDRAFSEGADCGEIHSDPALVNGLKIVSF